MAARRTAAAVFMTALPIAVIGPAAGAAPANGSMKTRGQSMSSTPSLPCPTAPALPENASQLTEPVVHMRSAPAADTSPTQGASTLGVALAAGALGVMTGGAGAVFLARRRQTAGPVE